MSARRCSLRYVLASVVICTITNTYSQGPPAHVKRNMRMGTNCGSLKYENDAWVNNRWNPVYIDELGIYTCLRFMDWQGINKSNVTTWSERGTHYGVTYDAMVDLCNTVGADAWFCVPHKANDDFVRQLARFLKSKLNDSLKAYIEYSNETWNTLFSEQKDYCTNKGRQLNLTATTADGLNEGAAYTVYRSVQIFEIFEEVYGDEMNSRVRKVICGHNGSITRTSRMFTFLGDPTINPDGVLMDAFGIAPYFGHGEQIEDAYELASSVRVGSHLGEVLRYNDAVGANAKLVGYEGGQHFFKRSGYFATNPESYDVYMVYLDWIGIQMDLFCHYVHVGEWSMEGMAWGAKNHVGQPESEAHKYRALKDWQAMYPYTGEEEVAVSPEPAPRAVAAPGRAHLTDPCTRYDIRGRLISGSQAQKTTAAGMMILDAERGAYLRVTGR